MSNQTEIKEVNDSTEYSVWVNGICLGLFEDRDVACKIFSIGRMTVDLLFSSNKDRRDFVKALALKR